MPDFITLPVIIAVFIAILGFLLILEPESLPSHSFESKKMRHEFRSSKHKWEKSELKSFYFCYLCHKLISSWFSNDVLECNKCGIVIHRICKFLKFRKPQCKFIIAKHIVDEENTFYHQWRQCSYNANTSLCSVCDSLCVGVQTYLCIWCHRVKHGECDGNFSCDFGSLRKAILEPTEIYCPNIPNFTSKAFTSLKKSQKRLKKKTSDDSQNLFQNEELIQFKIKDPNKKPVILVINKKSGGQTGQQFIKSFYQALNPLQVISILDEGLEKLKLFVKIPNLVILVGGGDGTVCSVMNFIKTIPEWKMRNPPIAILPLGTGNDLSRSLGWGFSSDYVNPQTLLPDIYRRGKRQFLDRWRMMIRYGEDRLEQELTLYNYVGFGLDAKICKDFHEIREKYPQLFFSQFSNKLIYTQMGAIDFLKGSKLPLKQMIDVTINGVNLSLEEIENVIFLNIMHWGGGVTNLWEPVTPEVGYRKQSYSDGYLEIIGLSDVVHMGQVQVGLDAPFLLGQASEIIIKSINDKVIVPIQIDGEPIQLNSPFQIVLNRKDQINVLATNNSESGFTSQLLMEAVNQKIIDMQQMRKIVQLSVKKAEAL